MWQLDARTLWTRNANVASEQSAEFVFRVENLPHVSRPFTSVNDDNIEKVKKLEFENRRAGVREVAEVLNISYGSTQHIVVHVLGMKRVATKLVPKDKR